MIFVVAIVLGEIFFGLSPEADRTTWLLENLPVFILLPLTLYLQPRLRLSRWILLVMTVHAFVLMLGGHYEYARVPFGYWLQETFSFSRNPYDRIGHFMQGFTPALILWAILRRRLKRGVLLVLTVVSMCLAISALYELLEWAAAMALGQGADAFLGTQGDVWDTQWDMFMALVGAVLAVGFCWWSRPHK